ncbi:hypothetical protein ACFU6S_44825 [Streptomyces sp. NPDC057456]|uniref:hypothetical protein n=1 Tax=Streptomyces sp. NPDC057456 TaxID=3346139 RepID=UPI0036B841D2
MPFAFEGVYRDSTVRIKATLPVNTVRSRLRLREARLWSVDSPHLYSCHLALSDADEALDSDSVTSAYARCSWTLTEVCGSTAAASNCEAHASTMMIIARRGTRGLRHCRPHQRPYVVEPAAGMYCRYTLHQYLATHLKRVFP